MSEMWHEDYERERLLLIEELDTVFEAASIGYLQDDNLRPYDIRARIYEDSRDNVTRLNLTNWCSDTRIVIEKILDGADDFYRKSVFPSEDRRVSFIIYMFDLMCDSIGAGEDNDVQGTVDYLKIEVYDDGRLALMYVGTPSIELEVVDKDSEEDDSDDEIDDYEDDDIDSENQDMEEGGRLLDVDYSEQGFEMHDQIRQLIRSQLGIDFWKDGFNKFLDMTVDNFTQLCNEEDK